MLMNNLISWTVVICDCVRALFRYASFSALQWQVIESGADLSTPRAARGLAGAAGEKTTHHCHRPRSRTARRMPTVTGGCRAEGWSQAMTPVTGGNDV